LVLPASIFNGNIQTLRINGTGSLTISSAISINNYLVLNGGNLIGSNSNSISLLNSSDTSLNRIGGYIEGSLIRRIPASSAGTISYLYPIGKVSYSPFELVNPITTSGGVVDIKAEVFEISTGGTAGTNMFNISSNRYWESSISSGASNFTSTNIKLTEASIGTMNAIARSATLAGVYNKANTNPASGSSITSNSLTSLGFFLFGNDSSSLSSSATLNITAFFEGLYLGSSTMTSSPFNADGITSNTIADTITIVLHDKTNYDSVYAVTATISTSGLASVTLPSIYTGNAYYIAIKHRNSLETWTADTVVISSTTNYDFTDDALKAYGSNLIDLGSGVFGIYVGDINQDGFIDGNDFTDVDNDNSNFASGYLITDTNGDGFVDGNDFTSIDNNGSMFISLARP
jgi:hypothetical protein